MTTFVIAPPSGRTIDHKTREPDTRAVFADPSSAQFQRWLAEMKRDHGDLGMRDMEKIELATDRLCDKSICIYNPFTGQIRRVEAR